MVAAVLGVDPRARCRTRRAHPVRHPCRSIRDREHLVV